MLEATVLLSRPRLGRPFCRNRDERWAGRGVARSPAAVREPHSVCPTAASWSVCCTKSFKKRPFPRTLPSPGHLPVHFLQPVLLSTLCSQAPPSHQLLVSTSGLPSFGDLLHKHVFWLSLCTCPQHTSDIYPPVLWTWLWMRDTHPAVCLLSGTFLSSSL